MERETANVYTQDSGISTLNSGILGAKHVFLKPQLFYTLPMNVLNVKLVSPFLFIIQLFFAQQQEFKVPDSLQQKTHEELKNAFLSHADNKNKAAVYAKTMLAKGKTEKDTSNILLGFSLLTHVHSENDSLLMYSDSILKIAAKVNKRRYLGLGNLNKAEYYFYHRNFKSSLDHYLIAKKYYGDDIRINFIINHAIGVLKSRVGDTLAAARIFKESWQFVKENNYKETENTNYLITLFSLADSYTRLGQLDSAFYFNRLGMRESRLAENEAEFYHFKLNQALNYFHRKQYNMAIDTIKASLPYLAADQPNLIVGYYYLGKSYNAQNEEEKAVNNFIKVDSLFGITGDLIPEARASYEHIIDYYESKNDKTQQLKYIKALIKVDSILGENYKYLIRNISLRYDTPKLLEEREALISALEKENNSFSRNFLIALVLLALSLTGLMLYYHKQRRYKKRFKALFNKKADTPPKSAAINKPPEISGDIIAELLGKLEDFEAEEGFLSGDLSISNLAKAFNTNNKYLSIVINHYKGKRFSGYINDLRIEYAIERLKTEPLFRRYSIKAIAGEAGFNSVEVFSKLFRKKTGIYPSYFIKNLEKDHRS